MADQLPDRKSFAGGYVKIKNEQYGGVRGLKKWSRLVDSAGPVKFKRDGTDKGVVS